MEFTQLLAFPTFPDSITLQWEIDNTQISGKYKFDIFINDIFLGTIYDTYRYKINYLPILLSDASKNDLKATVRCTPPRIDLNHQITVTERTTNVYHGLEGDEFNIAQDIVRRENFLFDRKIGLKIYIFKRKKYGQPCQNCVDSKTGTVTNSQCPLCYGTKYGFFDPIKVWGSIVEAPIEKVITEIGTSEDKKSQIRLTNEVMVSKKDIIWDYINDTHWDIVTEPTYVKYRSYPISQQLVATMIPTKNILKKLRIENVY